MEGSGRRDKQEIDPASQTCLLTNLPATPLSSPKAKTFSRSREGTHVKGCRLVGCAAINGKPVFAQNKTDTRERARTLSSNTHSSASRAARASPPTPRPPRLSRPVPGRAEPDWLGSELDSEPACALLRRRRHGRGQLDAVKQAPGDAHGAAHQPQVHGVHAHALPDKSRDAFQMTVVSQAAVGGLELDALHTIVLGHHAVGHLGVTDGRHRTAPGGGGGP